MSKWSVFVMFLVGLTSGIELSKPWQAKEPPQETPPYRNLDASLYMQSSAEYRACCLQAFSLAKERLIEAAKKKTTKKKAVVLDLDETVFDNSPFQSLMLRNKWAYEQSTWDRFEKTVDKIDLIPGAKEFLTFAKDSEIAIVFISNRNEASRETVKTILKSHDLTVPDECLLLSTTTSSKTERRKKASEMFDVVLLVGDNLRDFDDVFKYEKEKGIIARKELVDIHKNRLGKDWIILPNPAYGEWAKAFGQGEKDLDKLNPSADLK
jgi:5'-nucleotidase (lipoprotein e(P4) family)